MPIKSVLAFTKRSSMTEKEQKKNSVLRLLPLLLLMFYATGSVLRIALTSPAPSLLITQSSSLIEEASEDFETLKTHVTFENSNNLQAQEASPRITPAQCSEIIDGKSEGSISMSNKSFLCCDRRHYRTDVCYMRGDIRTNSMRSSILIHNSGEDRNPEIIRPYTRKFEVGITNTIDRISIHSVKTAANQTCSVVHKVPGLMFSTGGYTGNLYHDFSDGLIPLYITAQRFRGEVVLVVLEYHPWWLTKYYQVLRKLSNYKLVDFSKDKRVHCFTEMIVGLEYHGELTIDPNLMPKGKSIKDFQQLVNEGFSSTETNKKQLLPVQKPPSHIRKTCGNKEPKLVIFIRKDNRVILNLKEVIRTCQRIGFSVQIINPKRGTPIDLIQDTLSSADVMLGVHGAAMTHFLFMRPTTVLIQIVPLGLHGPADEFYGKPARSLGLEYMAYNVTTEESSLSKVYDRTNAVLANPSMIARKGWWEMKKIYLDKQNVKINIRRFHKTLEEAFSHICR